MILKRGFINIQKNALMEELKLIKVVDWATAAKLEKQDLKK